MIQLRLGLSTCPNDTYLAAGLLSGAIDAAQSGLDLELVLEDIQELNDELSSGALQVSKGSFALAASDAARLGVLPVGSAIGFGVGPLLLAAQSTPGLPDHTTRVLSPGAQTTAQFLFRLFHEEAGSALESRLFSDIMPALVSGDADFGICIHEGRFTYRDHGLRLVEDLGARYETEIGAAVPLGGLFVRHEVGDAAVRALSQLLRQSLAFAREHPDEALACMREHAQELSDAVLWEHVRLYVNETTADLGEAGRHAIQSFGQALRSRGLIDAGTPDLAVRDA